MRGRPRRGEGEIPRREAARREALRGTDRGGPPRGGGPGGAAARASLESRIAAAALPADWATRTWLALDFETTGLSPKADRIVEIGALRFTPRRDGPGSAAGREEGGSLSALVDPGMPIPPFVTGIHGIRDADVAGQPAFAAFAPRLLELAEGAIIIAHNAPFDLGFLREELARAGFPPFAPAALDTRLLSRAAFPGLPSYSLGNLARSLGIDSGSAHRALDDARTCMLLFLAAASRIAPDPGPGVPSLAGEGAP